MQSILFFKKKSATQLGFIPEVWRENTALAHELHQPASACGMQEMLR